MDADRYEGNGDDVALRALNLCDGYGGFEFAWRHLGVDVRTVARVERDSYAAAVLVERMETARLDCCPVWDDLESFDGGAWRGRVDLVTAGFPCQPFSAAGQRLGLADDRWLWPSIARIIADVRPGWVVLENVPGVVGAGLPAVLGDLARLGFDAEWGCLGAADVGAPHRRERWWCVARLADADEQGFGELGQFGAVAGERLERHSDGRDGAHVGHTPRVGCFQGHGPRPFGDERWQHDQEPGRQVDDTEGPRLQRVDGHRVAAGAEHPGVAFAGFPPGRDDHDGWREWIAAGGPQPVLRRHADGPPDGLADALHLGGNGLVPQAAAEAVRQLCARAGWVLS